MRKLLCALIFMSTGIANAEETEPRNVEGFWVSKAPDGTALITKEDDISVGRWNVDCRVDGMTDKRKCLIYGEEGSPVIIYQEAREPRMICVRGHDFPKRPAMIRVDKQPPVTTDDESCVDAEMIFGDLSGAKFILTRWYKWPYDTPVDTTTSLLGIAVAVKIVAEIQDGKLD